MAQSVRIEINEGHKLYKYCDRLTKAAGALWNAALSRITHGAAMCGKRESIMTAAERRVWNELMAVLPIIRSEPWFVVSPTVFLDSAFMNDFDIVSAYISADVIKRTGINFTVIPQTAFIVRVS